jgi:hypothetical protein
MASDEPGAVQFVYLKAVERWVGTKMKLLPSNRRASPSATARLQSAKRLDQHRRCARLL